MESMPAQVVGGSHRNVQTVQAEARNQPRLGLVPGSEKILSVTDRKLGAPAGEDAPAVAAESDRESAKPLSPSGWTARRPATEIQR
jgi:hypothetical protein